MSDAAVPPVSHDAGKRQFGMETPAGPAVLQYVPSDGALDLVHTGVPAAMEGKGYGTALVEAAFAHARAEGLRIIPTCPFVRHFVASHPEHAGLAAPVK